MTPQSPADPHEYVDNYWLRIYREPARIGASRAATCDRTLLPVPYGYYVPSDGPMFNEQYYWDTAFMALGLRETAYEPRIIELAENLAHLQRHHGIIPNANRAYFLSRSQPPLFTMVIRLAYETKLRLGHQDALSFLDRMMRSAVREHETVWLGQAPPHHRQVNVEDGLSRYFDVNYLHCLAASESGHDHSPRCNGRWLNHLPVDLNSILYIREMDFAWAERLLGRPGLAAQWIARAAARARMMHRLMWDAKHGFFFDVEFSRQGRGRVAGWTDEIRSEGGGSVLYRRNPIPSLAGFAPLWAGLATPAQADRIVAEWLPRFLKEGGLVTTTDVDVTGRAVATENADGERFQWAHPNGWAPLQWIAVTGLENYGYFTEAAIVRARWLETCSTVYRMTGAFWEKYNVERIGAAPAAGVYDEDRSTHRFGIPGFGWTNAIYQAFVDQQQRAADPAMGQRLSVAVAAAV